MTSPESQGRKENTVNSKQQEELHTLRGKWKINLENKNITGVDISYILDKSRKDYSRVVGTDGIGLARYQSECLAVFGIGTYDSVAEGAVEAALDTAVDAVQEVFSGYPAGTVTHALGETVVENVTNKIEHMFGITADTSTPSGPSAEVEPVGVEDPAHVPSAFLRRPISVATGVAVLMGGAVLGGVGTNTWADTAYAAPVEGQSMVVSSTVAGGAVRDGIGVVNSPAVQSAVASLGGSIPYVPVSGAGNSALVASALKYVGAPWDCTLLVEQALRDLGYSIGDVGPMGFGGVGTVFYDPSAVQAGDIMMRGGHVAIYAGDGMSVQGGFGFGGVVYNSWEGPSAYTAFVRVG